MPLGLRPRLLLAAVPPFGLVAAAAAAGAPGWAVAAASGLGGLAVAGGVVLLTAPFARLRAASAEALRQAGLTDAGAAAPPVAGPGDGTGEVSHAVVTLLDELAVARLTLTERETQFRATATRTGAALSALAQDWRRVPPPADPKAGVDPRALASLDAGVRAAAVALAAAHRRATGFQAVLNDIPDPVVVVDARQTTQFLNAAAEQMFGRLPGRGHKQPLRAFLADPAGRAADPDAPTPAHPDDSLAWVAAGRGGSLETVADTDDGPVSVLVTAVPVGERKSGVSAVLVVRDLTQSRRAEANTRHLHRRLTGQRLSLLVAREGGASLEVIRTQAGLLGQAAKQAGQRDRLVPKVQRILEEVDRQELVMHQLGWLGRLTTTAASEPESQEVRLRGVADEIADKLAPAYAERGNRLDVSGDAGWLIADEERVGILLTGILLHANQSCEQGRIAVRLGRRSSVTSADEVGEVVVTYPGPAPAPALIADVRDPFRRPNSGVFDSTGKLGFLLGLAVADKVAALMSGTFDVDGTADETTVRVGVPTRARSDNRLSAQAAAGTAAFVPGAGARDVLGDFMIGGGSLADVDTPAPAQAVAAGHPSPTPDAEDDSIGSFFGPG